ncbi:hypothetical protein Hdeb2414_s0010g00352361 [Helianthus debilis subsp. tardiflorus]
MDACQSIKGSRSSFQFCNKPFRDTTYTKVFVGGLPWETHSKTGTLNNLWGFWKQL